MVLRLDLGPVNCHLLSFHFKKGVIEVYAHNWKELPGPGHPVLAVWVFLVLDRTFPFGCYLDGEPYFPRLGRSNLSAIASKLGPFVSTKNIQTQNNSTQSQPT